MQEVKVLIKGKLDYPRNAEKQFGSKSYRTTNAYEVNMSDFQS